MSRYIDADALKEKIGNTAFLKLDDTEVVEQFIDTTPSIDIVRCKECKHRYDDGWLEPRWTCDYLKDMRLKDDDFCSYGEREGE